MGATLKRIGGVGVALMILNEIRGAAVVVALIGGWLSANPGVARLGARLATNLQCGVGLAGC